MYADFLVFFLNLDFLDTGIIRKLKREPEVYLLFIPNQ